ncbi:hypothetical protein E2P61_05405 [Candidatus Bathyarchaeota archaeon]|nr:hypothetical protein E2P61_05405 [Candidatus Bathyarchaeota archaeon]
MNLSKKKRLALILATVFATTFIAVFLVISITTSAYSTPNNDVLEVEGMDITVGPKPNATNIPLDTSITIDALSSVALNDLNDLHTTPRVPIASISVEVSGPLSYKQTFYPAQLLKIDTSYIVSVIIRDMPVSWSFTTTSDPFQPTMSYYLAISALWIALGLASIATLLSGSVIRQRYKKADITPT